MRSNIFLITLILSTALIGCGFKTGEKAKPDRVVTIQGLECLSDSISGFKLFMKGDATDRQVDQSVSCLQSVLASFKNNIRGQNEDGYTAREIGTFIEKNFFKDGSTFSNEFLNELMIFKVALIGGNDKLITAEEIDQIIAFLGNIKPEMVRVNRSMKIATFKAHVQFQSIDSLQQEQMLYSAKAQVGEFLKAVTQQFVRTGKKYQIDNLVNFISEIAVFAKADGKTIKLIDDARPVVKKLKTTFLGGGYSISNHEWIHLSQALNEGLFLALRNEYFLKNLNENQIEQKFSHYHRMTDDIAGLIENLLDKKDTRLLTNSELVSLSASLEKISPKFRVSEELFDHIGYLKLALLDTKKSTFWYWTKEDFSALRKKLPILFSQGALAFKSFNNVKAHGKLGFKPDLKYSEFLNAQAGITASIDQIMAVFEGSYDLNHLKGFIIELSRGPLKDELKLPEDFESLYKVVLALKTTITGQSSSKLTAHELRLFTQVGVRGLFNFLQYDLYVKPLNSNAENFVAQLEPLLNNVLTTLQVGVVQKSNQAYTNQELNQLLESVQVLYPQLKISEELINHVGHLKVALVGGTEEAPSVYSRWTAMDFADIQAKIPQILKSGMTIVNTYKQIKADGSFGLKPQLSYEEFAAAENTIRVAGDELTAQFDGAYNLQNIKPLIQELNQGPLNNGLKLPENFDSLFKAGLSAKTLVTGEATDSVTNAGLKTLLHAALRGVFHYFEFDLYVKSKSEEAQLDLKKVERLFEKSVITLEENLNLKKTHFHSTAEIVGLVQTLQAENLVKIPVKKETLENALNALWIHFLNTPEERLNGFVRPGFDIVSLRQVHREAQVYLYLENELATLFSNEVLPRPVLLERLTDLISRSPEGHAKQGLVEIHSVAAAGVPLNFNDKGFLKILSGDIGQYDLQDLSQSNLSRLISRLLIRSYANDLNRIEQLTGVTLTEAEAAYNQFAPVLVDLEVVEFVDPLFIPSRFREANLFLGTSDGNDIASFSELHQLVLHIFSGLSRAEMIREKVLVECVPANNGDQKVKAVWDECLLDFYAKESQSFSDLPQFAKVKQDYTLVQQKDFFMGLLKAAGHIPNDRKVVYIRDADLFPHVVQYIEMVYARFDVITKDNLLDKDEALAAFPVYQGLLASILKKEFPSVKEENYNGVFMYLLKYGKPPTTLAEKLAFAKFIVSPDRWIIQSTRLDLGKIFNYIADATAPKPPVKPTPAAPVPIPEGSPPPAGPVPTPATGATPSIPVEPTTPPVETPPAPAASA